MQTNQIFELAARWYVFLFLNVYGPCRILGDQSYRRGHLQPDVAQMTLASATSFTLFLLVILACNRERVQEAIAALCTLHTVMPHSPLSTPSARIAGSTLPPTRIPGIQHPPLAQNREPAPPPRAEVPIRPHPV